jgi:hypothetical protein
MIKTSLSLQNIVITFLSASLLTLMGGCATREKLARADLPEQIVLPEQVSYTAIAPIGAKWKYIALPGTYDAERKDMDGVYFYGAGRAIVEISEVYRNVPRLKVGGIYVPNDKLEPVQIIFAFEKNPTTTNDLNQYIQGRTVMTTLTPSMQPGISSGINIVGNVVAGGLIDVMFELGQGEITRVTVKDQATSDVIRSYRVSKAQ